MQLVSTPVIVSQDRGKRKQPMKKPVFSEKTGFWSSLWHGGDGALAHEQLHLVARRLDGGCRTLE